MIPPGHGGGPVAAPATGATPDTGPGGAPVSLPAVVDKRAEARRKKQSGPPNQSRGWFVPIVALVVVVGVVAVSALALTRDSDPEANRPTAGDHWHIAYGVYACDTYLAASQDQNDPFGIHTHGDGLIHIHPYDVSVTGDGARLAAFTDAIGADLTDGRYVPGAGEADGRELVEGQDCNGQPSELVLAHWPDALTSDAPPEIIREDLADFRFDQDGAAVAIALVPQGSTDIPIPPVLDQLRNPADT